MLPKKQAFAEANVHFLGRRMLKLATCHCVLGLFYVAHFNIICTTPLAMRTRVGYASVRKDVVMGDSVLDATSALRDKAWAEVKASPSFVSFKALDIAVGAMGGSQILAASDALPSTVQKPDVLPRKKLVARKRTRPSQGDTAEACLKRAGEPLPIRNLMEKVIGYGVQISGEDPLANFRSTLSRDNRFKSIMREGAYYWWLTSSPVPINWKEAEGLDFQVEPSASDSSSQNGGDGHAANNT